ncbi:MAG: isoprenyl transferase [Spartobacteria bacterium AMD-G5]|nr:MAG: isoprenyl transferase [Spartobacteria bacterium AMD-G5]
MSKHVSAVVPKHVAIIMDGNGRWAQQRGLPRIAGHEAGSKSIERCVQACLDTGVQYLTLYAFSSENWKRPALEVNALMLLLENFLNQKRDEMVREGIRLHHIGRIQELPSVCQRKLREVMEATASNTKLHFVLALSYSGRAEIVDAVKSLVRDTAAGTVSEADITPELIASRLNTAGMPDPDLLIRTSGEMRISNFLLWQLSYTEIHVTKKFWPDFQREDFLAALEDYAGRSRRFGGV